MSGIAFFGDNPATGAARAARGPARNDPRAAPGPRPFASVRVFPSIEAAADAWSRLEAVAMISPYQRRAWVEAWMRTEGRAANVSPMIVVAFDAAGDPVALLPLGAERKGLLRRAVFLGGRQTNYKMGLFDPRLDWTAGDAERLLRLAGRLRGGRVDTFELTSQPPRWAGFANPLVALPRSQPSPSSSHSLALRSDGEALLRERLSAASRKKLRAKAAHLAALGPVVHRVAATEGEIAAVVDAHLRQKAAKLAAIGVAGPATASLRPFFEQAAATSDLAGAALELHALYCGDDIVATFGGLSHAGRFSGTLISYDGAPAYARCSPGEILLTEVIKAKCAAGFHSFDLGVGEARYKDSYCPVEEPLVDGFLPLTPRGRLFASIEGLRLRLKAVIKRSPPLWRAAQAVRRTLAPLRRRRAA